MQERVTWSQALFFIAVACLVLLIVFLPAGLAIAISSGGKIGPVGTFGAGAILIIIAAVAAVGAGAAFGHRVILLQLGDVLRRLNEVENFESKQVNLLNHAVDELDRRRNSGHT